MIFFSKALYMGARFLLVFFVRYYLTKKKPYIWGVKRKYCQPFDFGSVQIFLAKLRLECCCSQVKWGFETNRAKQYKPPPPLFLAR